MLKFLVYRYTNGSVLQQHVDMFDTHVISVIMHIGHSPDEAGAKWPLVILNSTGGWSEVYLKNGEMVFYESARMIHGRPHPFVGESFIASASPAPRPSKAMETTPDD